LSNIAIGDEGNQEGMMKSGLCRLTAVCFSLFLLVQTSAFGQDAGQETLSLGGRNRVDRGESDRFHRGEAPERFMELAYETPAGPSRIMSRTGEDGGMTEYGAFYYSNDEVLDGYIDEAIYANPAIWEAEHRWRAALQRIPQVSSLPDPMVTIMPFISSPETRVGPQELALGISQKFPWFGKLDAKGEIALRDALAAAEQYQARIREAVAAVKRAYYSLAYLDEALRITAEDRELLEHFEEMARARYSTGKGIQQAVIKIQAEITRDDDRMYMLRQQRESVAANLNTLMDRLPDEPVPSLAHLDAPNVNLDLEELYRTGRANRHELKAAEYMIEKGDQAVRLAEREYFPDFTIGLNYIFVDERQDRAGRLNRPEDNGEDVFAVMLGFNIPLWDGKQMSRVRGATELKYANERNYEKMENSMEFSVRDGVLRAETALDQMNLYEKVLIPQAEQALDSTEAAYSTGKLKALDLIDSERFLLNVRLAQAKLKTDYMKALADIERATGTAFPANTM
jgi:outer membrane protein TolC